ncbi:MAG: hypothetical protein KGZ82_12260 [Bacteroidales bacterium]|nr:hypothetical protein [Bacteroidales bacterium]
MQTRHIIVFILLLSAATLFSCIANHNGGNGQKGATAPELPLPGYYAGSYVISEGASAHNALALFADSSFLLLRRFNADTLWTGVFGRFSLNGNKLKLSAGDEVQTNYLVEKNSLKVLDFEGNAVDRLNQFVLQSQPDGSVYNTPFLMKGAYFFMADAATLTFCGTARAIPVMAAGDNISAERLFLEESEKNNHQPVFVELVGSLRLEENMEGNEQMQIYIEKFGSKLWLQECSGSHQAN